MSTSENKQIAQFIVDIHSDNFADAEKSLRSVIESKLKARMSALMSDGGDVAATDGKNSKETK